MTKVSLIGHGKWGAVIDNALSDLKYIKWVDSKDADWIILSTPSDLHYEQVSHWLGKRKNVFCEKPLTLSYESAKELYDFADTMGVRLYVDDVFTWRDDYDIYDDVNHFVWTKPNQKDTNYIDRLAYHHFMMWVGDTDFEIEDITGEPNDFKIELQDGKTAEFFYGDSSQVVHFVNNEDMTNNQNNPLRTMFEFLFSDSGDYELNKKLTLNATKLSEQVKKTLLPKALVVGGGIFGTTSAVALAHDGYQVELHEELDDIMRAASDINQYRLHKGYHYPRSKETAQECLDGLKTFKRKYEDCVVNGNIEHYYAISSEDSFISPDEYTTFLDEMGLSYEKVESLPNTDIMIKADEELFDNWQLYESVREKLWSSGVEVLKNKTTTKDDFKGFDVVVVATYAKLNDLLDNKREYQFEVCEKPVVRLPRKYEGKSIVIMDGPFMCLDPYGDNHVLGNVVHAIHETNVGEKPIVSEELKPYLNKGVISKPEITNIDKFIETGKRFFKDFEKLRHVGSMYTIRTVLKNREQDDARPTLVNHEGNNVYSLFSGKIDTCVDAANELIKEIKK